jgi:uncharacterized iron-regulated membrane protein
LGLIGAIAGTCAAVAVVALGLLGLWIWRRRRGAAQKLEAKASGATAAPTMRAVPEAASARIGGFLCQWNQCLIECFPKGS